MKPVRGTKDLVGYDYEIHSYITNLFSKHMSTYGFCGIEPSILENKDLYAGTVGSTSDIVLKELFIIDSMSSICENKEYNLDTVLRAEGTMSCIRALINEGKIYDKSIKVFYSGPMFRYNRPQKGRLRQFTHLGCEVLNEDNFLVDAETIECIVSFLKSIGVQFALHINTIGTSSSLEIYRNVLYKFLKENVSSLSLINQSRVELNPMRVLDQLTSEEKDALPPIPNIINYVSREERTRFDNLCNTLKFLNIDFVVDPYLVRGLDYYQNTVFELIYENQSIAGGGCYKTNRFDLKNDVIGLGWAIGLERIIDLASISIVRDKLYLIFAIDPEHAFAVARILRKNHKKTLIIFEDVKHCLKRASVLNPEYVLFCGQEEKDLNCVKVKNWSSREEILLKLENLEDFFS